VVRTLLADEVSLEGKTTHFLVMEYVKGRPLRDLLAELGAVPEGLVHEIARQVSAGLAAIHEAGIVHRDLKPENVLITEDHEIRIMDLGVARIVEDSVALTEEGQFAGSLPYASPEQFRGESVGPAADLYSLGVLLYELVTGENPFRHDQPAAVMHAHLELQPSPADEVNPEVSVFFSRLLQELLEKDAGARLGSAERVLQLVEERERSSWWSERQEQVRCERARVPRIPVRRETALYGRETELALLKKAWVEARDGSGLSVLLKGEAGIGKTRLVDAFLREIADSGSQVLYGSYSPAGGIGGLSESVLNRFGAPALEDRLRPYLTATPLLVPAFSALLRQESPPEGCEPIRQNALPTVFCHLMRGLAAEAPLVWAIEDLHFAPEDSRKLMLGLARALEGSRILLILTTRTGLPEETLAHLGRLENHRRVELGRLSPREVVQLLLDAFGSEKLAEKLGVKIAYKSDGVPFFVFEMIRGLREGQFITELPDGTYVETREIERIEVPSAVRDLIEARLAGLTDEDRSLLDVAAVNGYEFDPDLVARVRGVPRVFVLERLAAIERRSGVVRNEAGSCRFDHHQIQEVLYADLTTGLRNEYHSLLASVFAQREEVVTTMGDVQPGELARFLALHHLKGRRRDEALPFLVPALEHLLRCYRNEELLELSDLALNEAKLLDDSDRCGILGRRARVLGFLGSVEEARRDLEAGLDAAERLSDPSAIGFAKFRMSEHLNRVSDFEAAREWALESLELAREVGDLVLEMNASNELGSSLRFLGKSEDAKSWFERSYEIARLHGSRGGEAAAAGNVGLALQELGRLDEAIEWHRRNLAISREEGIRQYEAIATGNLGLIEFFRGRNERASEYLRRSIEICRQIGDREGATRTSMNLGCTEFTSGRMEEAAGHFRKGLDVSRQLGNLTLEMQALAELGALANRLGDRKGGRAYFERCRDLSAGVGASLMLGYGRHGLGEHAEIVGDLETAEEEYAAALSIRRDIPYMSGVAQTELALGRTLISIGRTEEARSHLQEAISIGRELDLAGVRVLAACHLAQLAPEEAMAAVAAFEEYGPRLWPATEAPEARFLLWRLTSDAAHLEEAHRLLCHLRDHAPENYRETMIENVPLHRDIAEAWEEHRAES
jgi:tetratricopeptide (TPR) repeat protein